MVGLNLNIESILISIIIGLIVFIFKNYISKSKDNKDKTLVDMMSDIQKDVNVYKKMKECMKHLNCDRISLFQLHNGDVFLGNNNSFRKISNTFEIVGDGVSTEIYNLQNIPISIFSPLLYKLINDKHIFISDTSIKNDINDINDIINYNLLKSRGIISVYKVPIYTLKNNIMGYISIEYTHTVQEFDENVIEYITNLSYILSGYLYKYSKKL